MWWLHPTTYQSMTSWPYFATFLNYMQIHLYFSLVMFQWHLLYIYCSPREAGNFALYDRTNKWHYFVFIYLFFSLIWWGLQCQKANYIWCVWILLILLKIENNKKIFSELLFTPKTLFICLFDLFMSHKQCNRRWLKKKKPKTQNVGRRCWIQTPSIACWWTKLFSQVYSWMISLQRGS